MRRICYVCERSKTTSPTRCSWPGLPDRKADIELRAFAKTRELQPGESETVTMTVDPYTLASFNEDKSAWETAAGQYTARFGASSADIRAEAKFKIAKPQSWPVHSVCLPEKPIEEIKVKNLLKRLFPA